MKRFKEFLVNLGALICMVLIAYWLIAVPVSNWLECREHFSFTYCFTQLR